MPAGSTTTRPGAATCSHCGASRRRAPSTRSPRCSSRPSPTPGTLRQRGPPVCTCRWSLGWSPWRTRAGCGGSRRSPGCRSRRRSSPCWMPRPTRRGAAAGRAMGAELVEAVLASGARACTSTRSTSRPPRWPSSTVRGCGRWSERHTRQAEPVTERDVPSGPERPPRRPSRVPPTSVGGAGTSPTSGARRGCTASWPGTARRGAGDPAGARRGRGPSRRALGGAARGPDG